MIGKTVTHYHIVERIGEGGMGVVYRASDTRLGRQVALKFLSDRLSTDPVAVERFQREARAASSLNHPHICALYDIGRHEDVPFLVMELLDGSTLKRRVGGRPLPLDALLDFAIQAADALEAAHAHKIVHRDIKSANIFITDRGQVKMLDFGLAKLATPRAATLNPAFDTTLAPAEGTGAGHAVGTVTSMSPEQARGEDLDARSDLFSFGVVLYEMATGREPFAGKTSAVVFNAILNETPPPPSALNPHVPAELDHIIAKALEKDRDMRYQTAAELRADLKRLKRETDSKGKVPSAQWQHARRPRVPGRIVAAIAFVVVMLAAGALYLALRAPDDRLDVAVLTFAREGPAGENDYLGDAIPEVLTNSLKVPGLRVTAYSVARSKSRDTDLQRIGRDLKVKNIITGGVATRDNRTTIHAELLNVDTGEHSWGDHYEDAQRDLQKVQATIADQILRTLRPKQSGDDRTRVAARTTENPEAFQLYLQGRFHWNQGTVKGYHEAVDYFQRAIDKDARYAQAYAGLADSYLMLGSYVVDVIKSAETAAEKALQLDPKLAEAHVALGHIKLWLNRDWPEAQREFQRGIALDPDSALAHTQYAMVLATLGLLPDAIAQVRQAQELDPLSPIAYSDLGWYLLYTDQYNDAMAQFHKALEFDANSMSAYRGLGIAYGLTGRHDEEVSDLQHALQLENDPVVMGHLGAAYAMQGKLADAQRVLADLQAIAANSQYVPASVFATVYTAMGDRSRALDALDQAIGEGDFAVPQLALVPWFRPLHGEPRFQSLMVKLRLTLPR